MGNESKKSAFPIYGGEGDDPRNKILQGGLTKREYFAAMAMQGIISSHPDQIHNSYQGISLALTWADELLKQLEEWNRHV